MYAHLIRPLLFRMEAEKAHEMGVGVLAALSVAGPLCGWLGRRRAELGRPVELWGLRFPNVVGLAAGFDKDARCWQAAAALGFGHVEVGTVTALRQPGNPRPRAFRLAEDGALVNRMGFNNVGAEAVAARLARQPGRGRRAVPLGINLGKSKVAPLDKAAEDYLASFRLLAGHADYLVVNVSSPNTPDLRRLQEEARLEELLGTLEAENRAGAATRPGGRVPLLVKIAPDLSWPQVDGVLEAVERLGLDGVIATNTTIDRPPGLRGASAREPGGLSGRPLRARSTEVVAYVARRTAGRLPIIGVGGVEDEDSAREKLEAGASLVQVYTGLVYSGPGVARRIGKGLAVRPPRRPGPGGVA